MIKKRKTFPVSYLEDTSIIQCISPKELQKKFGSPSIEKWLSFSNNVFCGRGISQDKTAVLEKLDVSSHNPVLEVQFTYLDISLNGSIFQSPFGNERNEFVFEAEAVEYLLRLYIIFIVRDKYLVSSLSFLRGKRLGCFCLSMDENDAKPWQPVTENECLDMVCSCQCLLYLIEVLSLDDDEKCRKAFRFNSEHWQSPRSVEYPSF